METITYYRIYNDDLNLNYIGKTIDFNDRIKQHKSNCYNTNYSSYNIKLYKTIRDNGGIDNFKFMELDKIIFNKDEDGIEIRKMEQNFIELFNANLNSNRAYNSIEYTKKQQKQYYQEYRDQNKENIKKNYQEYYQQNRKTLNEKKKQYNEKNKEKRKQYYELNKEKNREQNREKLKQYRELNKEKCKQYREQNREQHKEKCKQYKEENRETLNQKYCCLLCRGSYTTQGLSSHQKTTKHKNKLNNN